jgi:hypothetical protein
MYKNYRTLELSPEYRNGSVSHGETIECWLKRWNELLTKNSAKTWQKLWDFGVQMAITITSLMAEPMLIMMIDMLKGFLTHYWAAEQIVF